ncbi:DUF1223 domain-containing protein [Magnetovibrio sp. PR-2]|uniref:DUF1223 domain-containing protein n=1 Tax=Magnetovibrio sp. PR-2 TaxID=3120356 RepID=UPI002FCDE64A
MKTMRPLHLIFGVFAAFSLSSAQAETDLTTPAPVVVELFTSQSCSSCPPADKLLGKLAQNPNVIAFSCHVTYWDHLNWRDTLSRKFCTERQRAYAAFMKSRQIYTPQMVVNGEHGFVGSNRSDALKYMSSSAVVGIELQAQDGVLVARMPDLGKSAEAQTLWLIRYHDSHTQDIPSGENRGRTITYTNSIETLDQVDTWDGTAVELRFELPEGEAQNPGFALLAQPQGFGPISAAGRL